MCVTGVYTNTNRLKHRKGSWGLAIGYHGITFTNSAQRATTHRAIHWGKHDEFIVSQNLLIRMAPAFVCVCMREAPAPIRNHNVHMPRVDGCLPMCLESKASIIFRATQSTFGCAVRWEPGTCEMENVIFAVLHKWIVSQSIDGRGRGLFLLAVICVHWMKWMSFANSNFMRNTLNSHYCPTPNGGKYAFQCIAHVRTPPIDTVRFTVSLSTA